MYHAVLSTLAAFLAARHVVSALQVSPNSPCATVCVDSIDDDVTDPSSSTTNGKDITCQDEGYLTTSAGKKFKECMECLQTSTYSRGSENDQMWFLYNLRYTFDYCVYAFPNASGVDVGPCATSAACGPLQGSLTGDKLDASEVTPYGYCSDGFSGEYYDVCLDCVAADHTKSYLANFLVALGAGCQQKPAAGQIVGLNDTVFADTEIEIIDPSQVSEGDNDESGRRRVTPQMIVGIIVGILALLAILSGFLFVRHRKRRARMANNNEYYNMGNRGNSRRPISSLQFRCQTDVGQMASPTTSMFSSPQTATQSPYMDEKSPFAPVNSWGKAYKDRDSHQLQKLPRPKLAVRKGSGYETEEDMTSPTPASAASSKSTAQLLPHKPYNPSEWAVGKPQFQSPTSLNSSPNLGGWSPVDARKGLNGWGPSDQKPTGRGRIPDLGVPTKKSHGSFQGIPIESKELNMNFSPPPKR